MQNLAVIMTRQRPKRKAAFLYFILIFTVILIRIGLWYFYSSQPNRVNRTHSGTVVGEFEYLTRRIDYSFRDRSWSNRKQAEADLDELEWLLENRYSYLKLKGIDYRAALDSIRSTLGDGISRGMLALQLMKLMALFGDGHSGISDPDIQRMFPGFLPFLIEQSEGRFIAFKPDRSGFLDPQRPFIRKIDDIELDVWLQADLQRKVHPSSYSTGASEIFAISNTFEKN
jgi:hypothetical protein